MTKRNLAAWHVVYLNTFDGRRRGYCIIDMTIEYITSVKRQPKYQHQELETACLLCRISLNGDGPCACNNFVALLL